MAAESLFTVCGLAISKWLAGGGTPCGLAKVRVFFKRVGSPSLGNESTQRCKKKKILIYCENNRLGAGKQQSTHVAMLIGWG